MYNLDRLFGDEWALIKSYFHSLMSKKIAFKKTHAKITIQLVFALPAFLLFILIPNSHKMSLLIPSFVAFVYALPLGKNQLRLREMPYAKIFSIAFVWAWLGAFLCTPVKDVGLENAILFLERFLLIYALTIPFDVRDMIADNEKSITTIPLKIGIKKSLSSAVIAFLIMLSALWFFNESLWRVLVAIISMVLVMQWKKERSWVYYLLLIDGCIFLDSVAILL